MKVLVAGGKGFIGSHLVNYLKGMGHWVRSVDTASDSYLKTEEDEFLRLDLRRLENVTKAVSGVDWVFNLAANMGGIGFISAYGADIMHDNALINIYMAEAAVRNNVDRIFFSSSACIYPAYKQLTPDVLPLKEEFAVPAEPDQFYGWEKLFSEKLYEAYEKDCDLKIRIARFHNIYGPYGTYKGGREKAPAALCRKVAEAKDGATIDVWGDGKQTRSFLYIDDCVEADVKLMESDYDKPLNIGSEELISIDQLADRIIGISGKRLKKRYDPTKPQGVRGRNADLTLIRKVLGWEPRIDYEEGLKRTYHWIQTQVRE
jgi:GDP-D-mannose 3',5'-epimerase